MTQASAAGGFHPLHWISTRLLRLPSIRNWFSNAVRMALLLVVVVGALLSTTILAREYQIWLLKVFLVGFLALLPGWLYLQFIRIKGTGLYDEYVLNLHRLRIDAVENLPKPPPGSSQRAAWDAANQSIDDGEVARNIYLKKFEAVYGYSAIPESRRRVDDNESDPQDETRVIQGLKREAFSPVVWTTVLIAVGLTVVVQPELFRGLEPFGPMTVSGFPDAHIDAFRFGVIGAFAFIIQGLVRRYFHADLKTHAYIAAMARLVVVVAIVAALGPFFDGQSAILVASLAFLIGMFPELGIRLMRQTIATLGRKATRMPDDDRYPVTDLDGINLWSRARLFEEGIDDMQNLTTANFPDLLLNTRVPIHRLVDWIDQAFLYLRLPSSEDRDALRRVGIRTATDLIDAFETQDGHDPDFKPRLLRVLNRTGTDSHRDDEGPSATEGLRRALLGEVNLWHVSEWKRHTWLPPTEIRLDTESVKS